VAIRVYKKIDATTEKLFPQKQKPTIEKTVSGWVLDLRGKKLKQREMAEKFWGIGAFAKS